MKKFIVLLFIITFLFSFQEAEAKRVRYNQYWTITSSTGLSLFYGDMSDAYETVFDKFMDMDQLGYATGLNFRYRLLPYFGLNMNVQVAKVQGKRTAWSDGFPVFYNFEGNIEEISLIGDIDMLDLTDIRIPWLSLYAKGGAGFLFHQSTNHNFLLDLDIYDDKESSLVLPFGGGARIYLSKNFGIQFETMWHYALTDNIDGYASSYTNKNDMYTFTSLGFIYKITSKRRHASFSNTIVIFKDRRSFYKNKRFNPGGRKYAW